MNKEQMAARKRKDYWENPEKERARKRKTQKAYDDIHRTEKINCGCSYDNNQWLNICSKHQKEWNAEYEQAQKDYRNSMLAFSIFVKKSEELANIAL